MPGPFHGSNDWCGGSKLTHRRTPSEVRAGHDPAGAVRPFEQRVASPVTAGTVPDACAGHGTCGSIDETTGQWVAPPLASSSVRSTASRLNEAGFWRGGYFLKFAICWATIACIMYMM